MLHKVKITEAPEGSILTLDEVKAHLNLRGSSQDDYLTALNKGAESMIGRYLNRTLLTTTYEVFADEWCKTFILPYPTLQTVDSVKYFGIESEDEQELPESGFYWVSNTSDPGKIIQKYDCVYPTLQYGRPDAIKIEFTAGYGDESEDVPEQIKHAIKLMITNYYEHKGDIVVGSASAANIIPLHVSRLIHDFRIYQF